MNSSTVQLKLHWDGGVHTELTARKNRTGHHDHVNSQEVTELSRELALVCEDSAIVSILNRMGYRTGIGNTWTEKRVQHVRHTKGFFLDFARKLTLNVAEKSASSSSGKWSRIFGFIVASQTCG